MKVALLILLLIPSFLLGQDFDLRRFVESNYAQKPDSLITQMALDSMVLELESEADMSWNAASFHQSEDGLVKIYHASGEGCGAYCNPMFQSVMAYGDTTSGTVQFQEGDLDLALWIDSIIWLTRGKLFLIFGHHSGRPRGGEGVWGQRVVLFSIESTCEFL